MSLRLDGPAPRPPPITRAPTSTTSTTSTPARPDDATAARLDPARTHVVRDVFARTPGQATAPTTAMTATTATAATATTAMTTDLPAIPARRLPALRDALVDAHLPALPLSSVDVPDDVLRALRDARRILVVGHTPPDGDCVGSSSGLVAALQAVGKDATAVVDDALPAASRAIDVGQRVRRAIDVQGPFDLVVLVDVAQAGRIGGARAFLDDAAHVLVVDHHEDVPDRASLGVRSDQALTSWIAPDADAASVLVGAIAARLGEPAVQASSSMLAAAMYTDTLGFRAPGADVRTLQLFKGLVHDVAQLDALETALQPKLPAAAAAIVDAVPMHLRDGAAHLVVDAPTWQALQQAARAADPRMADGDLRGALCDRLDVLRDAHGVATMLIAEPAGVRVSTRSVHDGRAAAIATTLGGGGHGRAAGGFVPGASVVDVQARLTSALRQLALADELALRTGRPAGRHDV